MPAPFSLAKLARRLWLGTASKTSIGNRGSRSVLYAQRNVQELVSGLAATDGREPDADRRFDKRVINHRIAGRIHVHAGFAAVHDGVRADSVAGAGAGTVGVDIDTVEYDAVRYNVVADGAAVDRDIHHRALRAADVVAVSGNGAGRIVEKDSGGGAGAVGHTGARAEEP